MNWLQVCAEHLLPHEDGIAVLVGDRHVAVFRTAFDEVLAVGNIDPFSGIGVISKGIVGDRRGEPTVSSPLHKQVFSLHSGRCLDEPEVALPTYPARLHHGAVEVGSD